MLRRRVGEVVDKDEGDSNGGELWVKMEYFCKRRRSKFDVTFRQRVGVDENGTVEESVEVKDVEVWFGEEPTEGPESVD